MKSSMEKLLRGIIQYRKSVRPELLKQFQNIKEQLIAPKGLMFTCMDGRMFPTRFLQSQTGDLMFVRNAGNIVPNAANYDILHGSVGSESGISVATEPAALDFALRRLGIKNVLVCGHSDCKAMSRLYEFHKNPQLFETDSPLDLWLRRHGVVSLEKLEQRLETPNKAVKFLQQLPSSSFEALIDEEEQFSVTDQLSQIHALQQLENIGAHSVANGLLEEGKVHLHALWFDVNDGQVYWFSKECSKFRPVTEDTVKSLVDQLPAEK